MCDKWIINSKILNYGVSNYTLFNIGLKSMKLLQYIALASTKWRYHKINIDCCLHINIQ